MTARLQSLDAFRGLTIATMILVNTPGSWSYLYPPLAHADWHGCTPTDLVFPFFLFIVGVSMWFSFKKFHYELSPAAVQKIFKRAGLIFLIGLLLNAFPFYNTSLSELRILGVLQRIALAFGFGAVICLALRETQKLLAFSAFLLLAYWGILVFFGGDGPYDLETNIVRQVDLQLLGASHLWQGKGIPFDPEGLLSSLPAIVSVIFGFLTGKMLEHTPPQKRVSQCLIYGIPALALGWFWGFAFPINKSLWTSSYVLYTTGWALLVLSLFIWLIDVRGQKKWAAPLLVFGMNSLFAYILSMVWVKVLWLISWTDATGATVNAYDWLFRSLLAPLVGNLNGSLLFAILHIIIFWAILWVLYRKRIFIKV